MNDHDRFLDDLRRGDEATATEFFRRYAPALERLAARNIAPGLKRRVGAETIAQSVCRTFLRRARRDEFDLPDVGSLWSLLSAIALLKIRDRARFHGREKRALAREVPLEAAPEPGSGSAPGPAELAAFADAFEEVLGSLAPEERRILEGRLEGATQAEIAAAAGCSERTVRRLLADLETRFRRAFD